MDPLLARSFVVVSLALISSPPPAAARETSDIKKWAEGPVRYIALKEEVKQFRALKKNADRALFVERFWQRRDPTPDTLTNEYRQLFWERVQQSNSNFQDSTRPGWMTDRGKVHILYGPPTEVQEEHDLSTGELAARGRGIVRWIYEGRPSGRMDVNPIVVVPFERDAGGEYRLSYDPKLASVFFDAAGIRERRHSRYERYLDEGARRMSELSVMLDLGRMQEVPPHEQVLLERVETMEAYETQALEVRVNRYLHPDREQTIVVITVDLRSLAGDEKPAIVARLVPFDATRPTRLLGEESFRVESHGTTRVAQGRLSLEPGDYALTLIVADPVGISTGLFRDTVRVPAVTERLRFSDVIWAAELESLPYASLVTHDEPFIVGAFKVLPRLEAPFHPGDTFKLFYEVYGAQLPVHITYQLEGLEADGRWVRLGRPATAEQSAISQGWELSTGPGWPTGDYRVRVEVRDAGDRLITTNAPFTLTPADAS